jgi:hypothetical protein
VPCSAAISNTGSNPSSKKSSPAIVGLVDGKQRRLVSGAYGVGDLLVARHQAFATIHNEDKEIRVFDRAPTAFEHQRV